MATTTAPHNRKPIRHDRVRRRLWIFGQRCHRGATGTVLTISGAIGIALMAHEWKDRAV
ncbi:MAG TPA: hypothetical protein VNT54_13225 [Solirubrobacteraceae bacterium]|nr:hypothetical protein [Solirubrobacteraceae bacterium]